MVRRIITYDTQITYRSLITHARINEVFILENSAQCFYFKVYAWNLLIVMNTTKLKATIRKIRNMEIILQITKCFQNVGRIYCLYFQNFRKSYEEKNRTWDSLREINHSELHKIELLRSYHSLNFATVTWKRRIYQKNETYVQNL